MLKPANLKESNNRVTFMASIENNFLATSAEQLAEYLWDSEYNDAYNQFKEDRPIGFQEFVNWIRNRSFYHVVYCICRGDSAQVVNKLDEIYDEFIDMYNDDDECKDFWKQMEDDSEDYVMQNIMEIEDPCPQW